MPAPDLHPNDRPPTDVAAAYSYRPDDPVWVHRAGRWRPGRLERASSRAVTVRYRPTDHRGTGVDTVTAEYLRARVEVDELLDGPADGTGGGAVTGAAGPRPAADPAGGPSVVPPGG